MAYAAAGKGGIGLRYLDAAAGPVWLPGGGSRVALVEITVRVTGRTPVQLGGQARSQFLDSTALAIALRNRE